jgi:hypothetical protein
MHGTKLKKRVEMKNKIFFTLGQRNYNTNNISFLTTKKDYFIFNEKILCNIMPYLFYFIIADVF